MMIADVGGSIVVRGRRIAIPDDGPMPGSTPINVPIRHPIVAHRRFAGVSAITKPCSK
jgi:hypothetical protein